MTQGLSDFQGWQKLVQRIDERGRRRFIVAIAGPPGSGKSTFAECLVQHLNERLPQSTAVIPMDGYHLDDGVLTDRGLLERKGAPETFDCNGFRHMLRRLRENAESEIAVPVFDRKLEISRAGARMVPATVSTLIVEGNYLLLNMKPWSMLVDSFDVTVMVTAPRGILEQRLLQRWATFGLDAEVVRQKVDGNDLLNADFVVENSAEPHFLVASDR